MPRSNLITVSLNSLENGISQQAAINRNKSQGAEQVNFLSDLTRGLITRPPAQHIARLRDALPSFSAAHIHHIDRDSAEKYTVIVMNGAIEIYDLLTGEIKTVQCPDGTNYLNSSNPAADFRMITVSDTTWLINRSIIVEMAEAITPAATNEAVVFVKRAMRGHSYTVNINGIAHTAAAAETLAGVAAECSADDVAISLQGKINATSGFSCTRNGCVLKITRTDAADFTFSVSDTYGNQGMVGIKGKAQSFTDLPAFCFNNVKIKVTGNDNSSSNDYYCEYQTQSGYQTGVWVESCGWETKTSFAPATMPHLLSRESDGSFTLSRAIWTDRKVGDDDTCPPPAFVGYPITDIIFHLNRLGIVCRDRITFSRDDDYHNFWPHKAIEVLADDPIEVATTGNNVSDICFAVPFNKSLLGICDRKQFQIGSDGPLTPDNVRVSEVTTYAASDIARPTLAGANMFFASPNGDYTSIREYYVSDNEVTNQATDITRHVPEYIPSGVALMEAQSKDDMLIAFTPQNPNRLYVYKYLWVGQDKMQSSWSHFEFMADDSILHFVMVGSDVYLILQRADGIYLEKMEFFTANLPEGLSFDINLDRRVVLSGDYNADNDTTLFTLPYPVSVDNAGLYVVAGGGYTGSAGKELPHTTLSPTQLSVSGDYSAHPCYAGLLYECRYKFSPQYLRNESEQGAPSITVGRTQIINMSIDYADSGPFEVTVTNREVITTSTKTGIIGGGALMLGQPLIDTGTFLVAIGGRNTNTEISIRNLNYMPVALQKALWEGYHAV